MKEQDLIEAYGTRGDRRWRRTFPSAEALDAYTVRSGAKVHGTRVIPGRFVLEIGMVIRLRSGIGTPTVAHVYPGQAEGAVATVEAIRPNTTGHPFWATLRFADGTTGGTDVDNTVDIYGAYTWWTAP